MHLRLFVLLCSLFLFRPAVSHAAFATPTHASAPHAARHHHSSFKQRLKVLFPLPFGDAKAAARSETNGWAIASLVCGLVGLFFAGIPLGICAVIFGALGLNRNRTRNRGLALAGLILGIVDIVGTLVLLSILAR